MPTIGVDCHILLTHAAVNGGRPVGFLLYCKPADPYGPKVSIHYESYANALGNTDDIRHLWFTVILSENLVNPDGSFHTDSAASMRTHLIDILMQHADITLQTSAGIIPGLRSSGHVMIHDLYPGIETIECNLTTESMCFNAVDPSRYADSLWVDELTYAGVMDWNNSYWRT